ncbi:hypothetical protein LTR16_005391, partial [Cryomyces antarcticus]
MTRPRLQHDIERTCLGEEGRARRISRLPPGGTYTLLPGIPHAPPQKMRSNSAATMSTGAANSAATTGYTSGS